MTYLVEQVLQPRAFVYTSNIHALILESTQPETRLTFLNSQRTGLTPSFSIASSNFELNILKNNTLISSFNEEYDPLLQDYQPKLTIQGATHATNFTVLPNAGSKAIVLKDFNESTANQYAGFEYEGGSFTHQLPDLSTRFIFQAAVANNINAEMMRIQSSPSGDPQVGIGTDTIDTSLTLSVSGNTQIAGSLKVTGQLEFNPTSFSNYIQYDTSTQRLPNTALPEKVPLLDQNNKIDESVIPQSFNFQYMKSQKNVGIGTRHPEQKFHVHGSGVFSERIGIGTLKPVTRCHILETAGSVPAVRIQNTGGGSVIEALLANSHSMILPGTHPSMGIGTSIVPLNTTLYVNGNTNIQGGLAISENCFCSNIQVQGKIIANDIQLLGDTLTTKLRYSPMFGTMQTLESSVPMVLTNELSVNTISSTVEYGRIRLRNSSLLVDIGTYLSTQPITLSDQSVIQNKVPIQTNDAMNIIKQLNGYKYSLGSEECAGLVGSELQQTNIPFVVKLMPDGKLGIRYDSIIPYLIESIKHLEERVRMLEGI